jgi:hypothetical protein
MPVMNGINFDSVEMKKTEYLFVTEYALHVLKRDAFPGDQAMLNADRDFSSHEDLSSDVRSSKNIVRFDHDSVDRILLWDKPYRTFSRTHGFVHIWSKETTTTKCRMRRTFRELYCASADPFEPFKHSPAIVVFPTYSTVSPNLS